MCGYCFRHSEDLLEQARQILSVWGQPDGDRLDSLITSCSAASEENWGRLCGLIWVLNAFMSTLEAALAQVWAQAGPCSELCTA